MTLLILNTNEARVHIACGETSAVEQIADAMIATRKAYPEITFELYSGTTSDLTDGFVRGHYNFLLECDVQPIGVHYSLATNTKFLAHKGVGVVITYENLITSDTGNTYDTTSDLTFIPLDPPLEAQHGLLWKKGLLSRQAQAFLDILQAQAH